MINKRETETSCDNWYDRRKMQQGKTARKDVEQTNKAAKRRTSDRSALKAIRDRDASKVMIAYAKENGTD